MSNEKKKEFENDAVTDPFIQKNASQPSSKAVNAFGILAPFMLDPRVSEIMVNSTKPIAVEKEGKLTLTSTRFQNEQELLNWIRPFLELAGKSLAPDVFLIDGSLPDGSRVHVAAPPISHGGLSITIRKFPHEAMSINALVTQEVMDQKMAYFLNLAILAKLNFLVVGGTGSGKTTLLNAFIPMIPLDERIVTIEDTIELLVPQVNSARLQTVLPSNDHKEVTARDLLAHCLRMRPDRIIVGEVRRSEAFDMLQAMNTGHSGSMTTLHANSPRDALARLETLCLLAGFEIPLLALRRQIASALDLIIQVRRFPGGKRRVSAITEVSGMEGEIITLQDIFIFAPDPVNHSFKNGKFTATGFVPSFRDEFLEKGFDLPSALFQR